MKGNQELKQLAFKSLINTEMPSVDDFEDALLKIDEDINKLNVNDIVPEKIVKYRENSGMNKMIINLLKTYQSINKDYLPNGIQLKKKILTSPSEPSKNDGKDNIYNFLIVKEDDIINGPKRKYQIKSFLGEGVSGQVFEVQSESEMYAMKIIKNHKAYYAQSMIEVKYLELLNYEVDKDDKYHIIRMIDYFIYYNHLCIVLELFNGNLLNLLQRNYLKGLSLKTVRYIIEQILETIEQIHKAKIIHCDLKPENILIKVEQDNINIKLTDFGSSCMIGHTFLKYIQSRYYRAPEVMLGLNYTEAIDIWSVGCIAVELYLGIPLFPGANELDQLKKIASVLGEIPENMILEGSKFKKYFCYDQNQRPILKPDDMYYKEYPDEKPQEGYIQPIPFEIKNLEDLLNLKRTDKKKDTHFQSSYDELCAFIHFLKGIFQIDPKQRWNAKTCLRHPFINRRIENYSNFRANDVSQVAYLSNSNLQVNEQMNNNYLYYSMMLNNSMNQQQPYFNNNMNNLSSNSFTFTNHPQVQHNNSYYYNNNNNLNLSNNLNSGSFYSQNYSNVSYDPNIYKPCTKNMPYNCLFNFPYAYMDPSFMKPQNLQKNRNMNERMNNTFAQTSFEKIGCGGGNVFYEKKYNDCHRNNKNIQNTKRFNNSKNNNNNSYIQNNNSRGNINNNCMNNFQYQNFYNQANNNQYLSVSFRPTVQPFLSNETNQSFNVSHNNNENSFVNEYEGLSNKKPSSFHRKNKNKRLRSQSDYNGNNPISKFDENL